MPFGGESVEDKTGEFAITQQAAASPMPFGGESVEDFNNGNQFKDVVLSPMPFGRESVEDLTSWLATKSLRSRHQCLSAGSPLRTKLMMR